MGRKKEDRPISSDVLITHQLYKSCMQALEARFDTHRLFEASDRDAYLSEVGPKIRASTREGLLGGSASQILAVFPADIQALLAVFCLASLTDLLDGYIARSRGSQTRLGAFLDPLADKLLLTSAFVTLTYLKVIPFWIAAVVVSRDLVLSVGVLVIHVAGGSVKPVPSWLGKLTTVFQMATVLAAMIAFYFGIWPMLPRALAWATAAFTVASGLQYIIQGLKQINPPTGVGARG